MRKIGEYFESGAQQVWLVFPEDRWVIVYNSPFDTVVLHGEDILTTPLVPNLQLRVGELFEL